MSVLWGPEYFFACHTTPLMRFITFHMEGAVSLLKGIPEWKIVYLKPSPQGELAVWPDLCGWQDLSAANTPWVSKKIQYIQCWLGGPCITQVMPKREDESHTTLKHSGLPKALIPFLNLSYSFKKTTLFQNRGPSHCNKLASAVILPEVHRLQREENAWMDLNFFYWQMTSYMLENKAW